MTGAEGRFRRAVPTAAASGLGSAGATTVATLNCYMSRSRSACGLSRAISPAS